MLAAVALLLFNPVALAEASLESRVKAAFLFNFTRFVDWPPEAFASADAPLDICVLGDGQIGASLDEAVRGKSINQRQLTVRRLQHGAELRDCKILYLGDAEPARMRELVAILRGRPVLTVGETPEFLDAGGMVRFLIVNGKVRFEINRSATERARLTLSSQLLGVAHAVINRSGS